MLIIYYNTREKEIVMFLLNSQSLKREKENTLFCFVFKDAEKRKGTSSSRGQADKWERFKRRNRRRARIFHRREKGGALAALSNCIPTFAEDEGRMVREVENETKHERDGKSVASCGTCYRIS